MADEVFDRALAHGATEFPFEKQFSGHETRRIRDPFGHLWGIGRVVERVSQDEMHRRMQAFYDDRDGA